MKKLLLNIVIIGMLTGCQTAQKIFLPPYQSPSVQPVKQNVQNAKTNTIEVKQSVADIKVDLKKAQELDKSLKDRLNLLRELVKKEEQLKNLQK